MIRFALLPLVMTIFVLLPRGLVLILFEGNFAPRRRATPDVATELPRVSGVPEYQETTSSLVAPVFVSPMHEQLGRLTLVADDYSDVVHVLHYSAAQTTAKGPQKDLARQIESLGGQVLLFGDDAFWTEKGNRVAAAPSRLHISSIDVDSAWVQNYWGLLCQTDDQEFVLCATDIAQADRPQDARALEHVAAGINAPLLVSSLKLHGASVVSFGNGTAVVSRSVAALNSDRDLTILRDQLAVIGIRNPIFCPPLPGEPGGHMDMCVGWLNGHAVVPSVDPRAIRFAKDRTLAETVTVVLDRIATMIEAHGYPVVRLVMPVPQGLNYQGVIAYYTPVNWVVIENQISREKSVLIPVPQHDLPDSSLNPSYREQHARVFEALRVRPHYFPSVAPEFGGGLKCMTGKLPRSLVTRA